MFRKNVAGQFVSVQMNKTADGTPLTGATVAVRRCIDGTFAAATGTVTEDTGGGSQSGLYKFAMSQADTNGNDIQYGFSAANGISVCLNIITTACDPTVATNFGITSLPTTAVTTNASLLTSGTGTDQLSVASGRIDMGKLLGTAISTPATAGILDVNIKNMNNVAATAITTIKAVQGLTAADTIATYTGNTPQTGDSFSRIGANGAGLTAVVAASVTGAVGSVTGSVGSVVGLTAANLDVAVSSRLAAGSYTAPDNASIATILGQTGTTGVLLTAGYGAAGQLKANIKYVNDIAVTGSGTLVNPWGP